MKSFVTESERLYKAKGYIVWSTDKQYKFTPDAATWDSNVVTIVYEDHGLINGDSIDLISSLNGSGWNTTGATITVLDKDSFTFPLVTSDPTKDFPSVELYGSASQIEYLTITCSKYSELMIKPKLLQVNTLPGGVTITIQVKLHHTADWFTFDTVADTDGVQLIDFSGISYNYVRCYISAGSGQPLVFAQFN